MTASNSKVMAKAMQSKTDIFIQKARLVFGDTFGYQCTRYVKNTIKIKINCPKHGLFEQTPKQHLKGSNGCKKCIGEKGRLTTEEFINRSESKHSNKYKYDRAVYTESTTKVQIFCTKCVKYFYQLPHCHMYGQGCPVCAKQLMGAKLKYSIQKFIELAKEKHGSNHYDYSLVKYRTAMDKVKIKCLVHDCIFEQKVYSHLSGQGCPDCGGSKKPSTQEFIRKAKIIHNNKDYTYDKVDYINAHIRVVVTCKHHGDFTVKPNAMLSRSTGCPTCSKASQGLKNTIKFDQFLSRATKVHGDRYTYNESSYTSVTNKVEVNCFIHGAFHQLGTDHINGHGCKKCGMNLNGFSKTNFINICKKNNSGIGHLYVIKCFNNDESFFKIGITSQSVNSRFAGKFMPYKYETEFIVMGGASAIYDLETQVHRFLKKHKYSPDIKFKGSVFECFTKLTPQVRSLLKKMCENDQQLLIA